MAENVRKQNRGIRVRAQKLFERALSPREPWKKICARNEFEIFEMTVTSREERTGKQIWLHANDSFEAFEKTGTQRPASARSKENEFFRLPVFTQMRQPGLTEPNFDLF